MKKILYLLGGLLVLTAACGSTNSASEPQATVSPIVIGDDLTTIDLCQAIPIEDIEAVMGQSLERTPERFEYYNISTSSGCAYDAGEDSEGNALFGYVVLTPADVYDDQPVYQDVAVNGIGQSAYFNNGADARQLWVKVNDQVALVVAFGDVPNEAGAQAIARLVVAAIQ